MTIKDHLPAHTHTQNTLGLAELHTWTTPNGTWTITQSLLGTGTAITGPGIRAALGVDQGSDDQVVALLRVLGAIDPAPEPLPANEPDWRDQAWALRDQVMSQMILDAAGQAALRDSLESYLTSNADPYDAPCAGALGFYDAARLMIDWLREAHTNDLDGPGDRLSATETPETPRQPSGGQSGNENSPTDLSGTSKVEVVDPQQIRLTFQGDEPSGQQIADLVNRIIESRSQPARAIPMPIVLSDAEADHLLSDIEAAALLQEASKIVPTAAAAYGATTEWCERIEGWTERYKTWIENRGGNSSAAGETTPAETSTGKR